MVHSRRHLAEVRRRSRMPEFRPACDRIRAGVADLRRKKLQAPEEPAGYYHDFFCPEHAVELIFDPASPRAHRCPVDRRSFSGEPFDSAWRWTLNTLLSRGAFGAALLWRIDRKREDLRKAVDILVGYAGRYASYLPRRSGGKGLGRCCYHSLDESVWLIPLARAFDLIRPDLNATPYPTISH